MRKAGRQQGFTLIELLIVVAIILVIAAIAIPNLLQSRMAANEASAVGSVKAIQKAELAFQSIYPDRGFTCSFTRLGPPPSGQVASEASGDFIDNQLSSGVKSGYTYTLGGCSSTLPHAQYWVTGAPTAPGQTGNRAFCSDESNVVSYSTDGNASTCQASGINLQ